MSTTKNVRIVIVGGVAGGASAATRARRMNERAEITIFEKDRHVSFANCGVLPGADRGKLLVAKPELFEHRFRINVRTRHEVLSIDRAQKTVRVRDHEGGREFDQPYDKLILSPGASPIIPPNLFDNGQRPANVFAIRNLDDTDALKTFIQRHHPKNAVVVGGGYIGLEMIEQLHHLGLHVALAELADQVMLPLDREMAAFAEDELRKHGVELHLGDGLAGLATSGNLATGVRLNSGATLDADLVILGIGVRANTQLASDARLTIGPGGGITINESCQTSDPAIYAVGDAVEYTHAVINQPMRIALGGPANRAGRVAGEHAATGSAPTLAPVLGTSIVRVFGLSCGLTGASEKLLARHGRPFRSVVVAAKHHAGYYPGAEQIILKLTYDPGDGRVLGLQAVGGEGVDKRLDVAATAIQLGASVDDLAGLDLAYAPPFGSAKDPIHMAAFVAQNDLRGVTPIVPMSGEPDADTQIIDVRTATEFEAMRLPGATRIELEDLRQKLDQIDPARPVFTICHSGQRAHAAARLLREHGLQASNITGGMLMQSKLRPDLIQTGAPTAAPTT